jgi:hypothetical protein
MKHTEQSTVVCSVDHSPDGRPAGWILARVHNPELWLDQNRAAYPNCRLSAELSAEHVAHGETTVEEPEPLAAQRDQAAPIWNVATPSIPIGRTRT